MASFNSSSEKSFLLVGKEKAPQQTDVSVNKFERSCKELRKSLGFWHLFAYVVSVLFGSGIFISPALIASQTSNMGMALVVWVVTGAVCLFGGLCFCELATALRKTGGEYIFVKEIYGDVAGFFVIWAQTIVISPSGFSILAVTIGEYIVGQFYDISIPSGIWLAKTVAVLTILLSVVINCLSNSAVVKTQVFFTVPQVIAVLFIVVVGIWKASTGNNENYLNMFVNSTDISAGQFSLALYNGLWAYDGWGILCTVIEEVRDPNKDLQLAIATGMPFVIACYVLLNLAFMSVLTHHEIGSSATMATNFIKKSLGESVSFLIPVFVSLSCFGCLNAWMFMTSRSILSASREGHLPALFSCIHSNRRTPVPALLLNFVLITTWILAVGEGTQALVTYFSFAIWLTYGLALFGVIVLRFRKPDLPRPYKVWIVNPLFLSLISVFLVLGPFINNPVGSSICLVVLLTSIPLYYAVKYQTNWIPLPLQRLNERFYSYITIRLNLVPCKFQEETTEVHSVDTHVEETEVIL